MKTKAHRITGRALKASAGNPLPPTGAVFTNVSVVTANSWTASEMDHRANDLTSTLKDILTHTSSAQHWGINE
jgi:hypothetical protein